METGEKKIAAFFKLLDEWSRERDADFIWWQMRGLFGGNREQGACWCGRMRALGGSCGGGCDGWFFFT